MGEEVMTVAFDSFTESTLGAFVQSTLDARKDLVCSLRKIWEIWYYPPKYGPYYETLVLTPYVSAWEANTRLQSDGAQWRLLVFYKVPFLYLPQDVIVLAGGSVEDDGTLSGIPSSVRFLVTQPFYTLLDLQLGCPEGNQIHWPDLVPGRP